jgi:hypothetical protein
MQTVCRQFAAGAPTTTVGQLLTGLIRPELRQVAQVFAELQDSRHEADYEVATTFTRVDVLQKIAIAQEAFAAWQGIRSEPNTVVFLAALLLQPQWR